MSFPRVRGYKMTSMAQVEVGLLAVCLLLHFFSWNSVTVNGETVFEVTPFSFGVAFAFVATLVFVLAILSKFIGRFSGFSAVVFTHMAALAYLSSMAAKKMSDYAEGLAGLSTALGATGETTKHISTGGVWFLAAIVAFVLVLFLFAAWGVSAYRLSKFRRQELRSGYLWGIVTYLVMVVISAATVALLAQNLRSMHFGGSMDSALAGGYTMAICGITFFVMLVMLIINASVLLLCEALRGNNKRTLQIVSYVLAVLFFMFMLGVTSAKSKLAFSIPSSIDDLVMMASEYGLKWMAATFMQFWLLAMAVACAMRGIYFSRHDETDDEATEEPAEATMLSDDEETNPNKKYYIGGGVAVAVLAIIFLLFRSCSGGALLHGQKPAWDKFVTSTGNDVPLYKEADTNSPVLQIAVENTETDNIDSYSCWTSDDIKRGYTAQKYTFDSSMVSPVLEEKDGWYKVAVGGAECQEAWVQKEYCREVTPTPITPEVLEKLSTPDWNLYHLVKDGKLKNLVLHLELNPVEGNSFELCELMDGVLVSPEQHPVSMGDQTEDAFQLKADGNGYWLTYTEDQASVDERSERYLDPQKLTAEQIQQLYEALVMEKPTHEMAYYYFPELNDNTLYGFYYSLTGDNTATPQRTTGNGGDEIITDYRVLGDDGDWFLEAILGEKGERTDISSSMRLVILDINDYDGDGNKECIIQEDGGGSAGPEPPYIVYYDSDGRQYRKTETLNYLGQAPEVVTENGQTSILFRRGIQWVRYVFENHALRETENEQKDMGETQMAVTTSMLFKEEEEGSKTVECDLDDDGIPEVLTFSHNTSHAYNFGEYMSLDNITWGRDQSETSTNMMGIRFVVLKSKTNYVRDMLADNLYYRWDGTKYVSWKWNGDDFVQDVQE